MMVESRRFIKTHLLVFLFFVIVSLVLTWPWVLYFNQSTFGSGHPFNVIWRFWWQNFASVNRLDVTYTHFIGAPGGAAVTALVDPPLPFFLGNLLTRITAAPVFSYNSVVFLSFVLSGYFAYLLFSSLTKSFKVAILFALLYEFSPYRINHLGQFSLASVEFIPLILFFFLRLRQRPSIAGSTLLGLFFSLNFLTDYYYGYFSVLFLIVFVGADLLSIALFRREFLKDRLKLFPNYLFAGIVSLLLIFPFVQPLGKLSTPAVPGLPLETTTNDLVVHSARPWDYVLPSAQNPLLGFLTVKAKHYLTSLRSNYWFYLPQTFESTLYLGLTMLSLLFFGLLTWFKNFRKRADFLIPVLSLTALMLLFISLPPDIYLGKNQEVHKVLLSYRLHKLLPMFRAYVRLGIFVLLPVMVGAALTLESILAKLPPRRSAFVFTGLALLMAAEFYTPLFNSLNVFDRRPEVYAWLARTEKGTILAENSEVLSFDVLGNCSACLLFVPDHQKYLYGPARTVFYDYWTFLEKEDSFRVSWGAEGGLRDEVFQKMKRSGVRYLVVHLKSLTRKVSSPYENLGFNPASLPTNEFKLVSSFKDDLVYELL